jgi:hypothetical protein
MFKLWSGSEFGSVMNYHPAGSERYIYGFSTLLLSEKTKYFRTPSPRLDLERGKGNSNPRRPSLTRSGGPAVTGESLYGGSSFWGLRRVVPRISGILEALGAAAALNAVAVTGSGLAAGAVSGAAASGLYRGSRLSICWLEEKRGSVKIPANKTVKPYCALYVMGWDLPQRIARGLVPNLPWRKSKGSSVPDPWHF